MSSTLQSPGAQVTVIDESQYLSAPAGTAPLFVVATAQNKTNPSGVTAPYTTANTAGLLTLETSQRSLINDFGAPIFQNVQGTPVNASEQNEYGLMAAYSALGVSDAAYILRAPVDLNALTGTLAPPVGTPANGTIWLNAAGTKWGILEYNAASQSFAAISTTNASGQGKLWIVTDPSQTSDANTSVPVNTIGKPGDYSVVLTNTSNPVWKQDYLGNWVEVGTASWQAVTPAVIGAVANPSNISGILDLNGTNVVLAGANLITTISEITAANVPGVNAFSIGNRLALSVTSAAPNSVLSLSGNVGLQIGIASANIYAAAYQVSTYTNVPKWNATDATPEPTGSVWYNTSIPESGANISVQVYNSASNSWTPQVVTIGSSDAILNYILDPIGGGINIPAGTFAANAGTLAFTTTLLERQTGATTLSGTNSNVNLTGSAPFTFTINTTVPGSNQYTGNVVISFAGSTANALINAVNAAGLTGISASFTYFNTIEIQNTNGGSFCLYDGANTPLEQVGLLTTGVTFAKVSNWVTPSYVESLTAPTSDPANGTLWFYDDPTVADIMINTGTAWLGYRNVTANLEARGYNLTLTDPSGPIVSATVPVYQSTGNVVVNGDIWINTSDITNLPNINRYQSGAWIKINNVDHTSSNGVVFADARWATTGNVDPATSTFTPISTLLTSNYLDSDAPSYALYPRGTLLFNTRRSGMNVKQFTTNHLINASETAAWVTASGNNESGVAYLGSAAQRNVVVQTLVAAIENSDQILEELYNFGLISCTGYPELLSTLVTLNINRGETAFIVADSPMTLAANANAINTWANNLNAAPADGVDGLVTFYDYAATYYPSGLTTDLSGNKIVVPASFMAVPTIIQSDAKSYPWFAPAGPQRGLVTNATSIGYVDGQTGNFVVNSVAQNLRDILYPASVNPISNVPGTGLELYGQKTRAALINGEPTALNRINVARLVIYLRNMLNSLANSFTFEQNDSITRHNFGFAIGKLLKSLQSQRAISDWAVDVSTDINTQTAIENNQLWAAVAIAPITVAEFIYIPVTVSAAGTDLGGGAIQY